jgi:DNA-directed RNA polymerase subunit N (RpoN/RPB10)
VYPYAHNTASVISAAMGKMHLEAEEVSPLSPSEPAKGLFGYLSIHMDWVGLDGFESQTSQTSSHFFPNPSNPCVLGITEQALKVMRARQQEDDSPIKLVGTRHTWHVPKSALAPRAIMISALRIGLVVMVLHVRGVQETESYSAPLAELSVTKICCRRIFLVLVLVSHRRLVVQLVSFIW